MSHDTHVKFLFLSRHFARKTNPWVYLYLGFTEPQTNKYTNQLWVFRPWHIVVQRLCDLFVKIQNFFLSKKLFEASPVYIFMYIFIYLYVNMYTYVCRYICVYTHICRCNALVDGWMFFSPLILFWASPVYMCIWICIYICECVCVCVYFFFVYVHIYICIYIFVYICIYTYI